MSDANPQDFKAALPEELRSAPALADVKDIVGLAKAFVETKAFVGGAIRPPGPDASPEARKDFVAKLQKHAPELVLIPDGDDDVAKAARDGVWSRLGKPKEAKEYAPPKDVELPESALEALRAEAAEEGLTRGQFEVRAKRAAEALGVATKAETEARAALKRELGGAYDERIGAAAAAAEKLGFPEGLVKALRAGTVDLSTYKALAAVAKGFGESRQVAEQGPGGGGRLTPSEARAQRAEIMSRPEYFAPKPHQMAIHAELVRKAQALRDLEQG